MAHTINFIIISILAVKFITVICQERSKEDYRLPNLYTLHSYHVTIGIDHEVFTETGNEFIGKVNIELSFKNSTDFIALHAHPEYITIKKVTLDTIEIPRENFAVDFETEIVRINTTHGIIVDKTYILEIEYSGVLNTVTEKGFFKSYYNDGNGNKKYLLGTFFSPFHARKAFPCFDEPMFKSKFIFSFKIPQRYNVMFNTAAKVSHEDSDTGLTTVVFLSTPKISTYLLAFLISEFTCTSGNPIGFVQYQVCSRPERADDRRLALRYGPILLEKLNDYMGYSYGDFMYKLDQVAFPKYSTPAMENLGLIAYIENGLLWNEQDNNVLYKQQVITFIAHELSHMWFGDLVTHNWWSAMFLKEGFATYFQYLIPDDIFPEWELEKQFVVEQQYTALIYDSKSDSHALQSECYTQTEITTKFSRISYSKGACVLRMVEHVVGKDNFRKGLQNLIKKHHFGNIAPEDVWVALNESILSPLIPHLPADLPTIMDTWINKAGYPLLHVTLHKREVTIFQTKFFSSGENDTRWYVPISYSTSLDVHKTKKTSPVLWLTPTSNISFILPSNCDWIILNNQQTALYRVNYDENMLDSITKALLRPGFDYIDELNRAQIVNDLFNLAEENIVKYSKVFSVIKFLANDKSYYPWCIALFEFETLFRRIGDDTPISRLIAATVSEWMAEVLDSVPLSVLKSDDQLYTFKQIRTHILACGVGNENCIEQVRSIFNEYKETNIRPHSNLRELVYCYTLRYSNDSSDWEFLWESYINTTEVVEQETLRKCLCYSRNETLLKGFLHKSLSDGSDITTGEAFYLVTYGSSKGADVAFEFIVENVEIIIERRKDLLENLLHMVGERFVNNSQVSKLRSFIESGKLPEEFQKVGNQVLLFAEIKMELLQEFENDMNHFYGNRSFRIIGESFWIMCAYILLFIKY